MRLVAVSIVKNEADIIEAFVRHSAAWVDHHLVFDHHSTDGTRELLTALQREGMSLTLYTDDQRGNLQQQRSNVLTRLAVDEQNADWVIPLDADEILDGTEVGPAAFRARLEDAGEDALCCLRLWNYYATRSDDAAELNPVLRLRYCSRSASHTVKMVIPRSLAADPQVSAGKGSHQLFREGQALPFQQTLSEFFLAHLAMRSTEHQILRVVQAELQKLSRGEAHRFLDTHYRLGYQLLETNPLGFMDDTLCVAEDYRLQPIRYRGTPLQHSSVLQPGMRLGRSLLPFLREMAQSHGRLQDKIDAGDKEAESAGIREIVPAGNASWEPLTLCRGFTGFRLLSGLEENEGPVPEAFLPVFRWGLAPETRLVVESETDQVGRIRGSVLTYCENQIIDIQVNGCTVHRHHFELTNQVESLEVDFPAKAGLNTLTLSYAEHLTSEADPRRLAVIFLGLRVDPQSG